MRDGAELARSLANIAALTGEDKRAEQLSGLIQPYIQVVSEDARDEWSGLRLADIWRYFRYTWLTPARSVPERGMMILVRDGAVPFHPVIGISALSSCVVQLTERDERIGWTRDTVLKHLTEHPTAENATWLLSALGEAFEALQTDDLVTPQELEAPTPELIESLTTQGKEERKIHQQHAKNHAVKQVQVDAAWAELVGSHLYKSKRALTLASLLETRLAFRKAGLTEASGEQLAHALATGGEDLRKAVGRVVRQLKAVRVGISMMDVSICGALAPYSPLLGGKLVSMLLASPELRAAYAQRYGGMASVIASGMKGEPVRRKPELVLLGTTGLFAGGSSQYNRVKIPASILGGAGEVRYIKLERETEYATFHISQATMEEMKFFMEQTSDGSSVNSIFGEGVNPKMRKISESFKAIGFPPDKLLKAGTPRVVYMIPLAHNFREYLQGRDEEPNFILSSDDPIEATEAIAEFWRKRWLAGRIHQPGVLDAVSRHTRTYPMLHGAAVRLPELESEADELLLLDLYRETPLDLTPVMG